MKLFEELEGLEEVRKRKEEIERKIEEKTGKEEGPITRRIASAGLSEELKEEAGLHSKLQSAERYIEEAQKITESINTEEHEKLLEKYRGKGEFTVENNYEFTEGLKQVESYLTDIADREGGTEGLRWEGLGRAVKSFRKSYENDRPIDLET